MDKYVTGSVIRRLRENKKMTQEELAEALYVSRTAVSKWESGRGTPSIDSLKELSRFFSVSIDELLSGEALVQIAVAHHPILGHQAEGIGDFRVAGDVEAVVQRPERNISPQLIGEYKAAVDPGASRCCFPFPLKFFLLPQQIHHVWRRND